MSDAAAIGWLIYAVVVITLLVWAFRAAMRWHDRLMDVWLKEPVITGPQKEES